MTPYGLEKPRIKEKVIALVLDGKSNREIAAAISTAKKPVSFQAIARFRKRHATEIEPAIEQAAVAVVERAITDKSVRLVKLDDMFQKCEEALNEYGVMITEESTYGSGEHTTLTITRRFNGAMIREMRGLLRDAAEELGQMPRPDPHGSGAMRELIIREYAGWPAELQ